MIREEVKVMGKVADKEEQMANKVDFDNKSVKNGS